MKRVLLRGPFLTSSGYGVHARQVARWALSRSDWDIKIQAMSWGITPWLIDKNDENGLIGTIMEKTASLDGSSVFDISFQVQLPNEWDSRLARVNIGITAAVETDRCNPEWIEACNRMTAVVVPSNYTKSVLESSGTLRVPVLVIPESYHDELAQEETQKFSHEFSTKFNFLVFGQLTGNNPENDRKNLFYTLKWILEEFKDEKDVGVILKTNSGRQTKIDKLMSEKFVNQMVKEVRKSPYPKVNLLHGKMSNREITSLMRDSSVKALVSLTRGEGYGLPILEAAAVGLPVIATGWSGHLDFLKSDFISVDYALGEIHASRVDNKIFIKGAKWAHPSEKDAKRRLRKFYESSIIPRNRAIESAKRIQQDYSFSSISKIYEEKLSLYL
jgi:glycosyltransferase involved in cell wall biosynthesis